MNNDYPWLLKRGSGQTDEKQLVWNIIQFFALGAFSVQAWVLRHLRVCFSPEEKLPFGTNKIKFITSKKNHLAVGRRGADGKTVWNYLNITHAQLSRNDIVIVKKDVIITREIYSRKGHPAYTLSWHLDRRRVNINYCQIHRGRPRGWSCQV